MAKFYPLHEYAEYLSVLSAHKVQYKGIEYQTAEHAYHCQRHSDARIIAEIKDANSAHQAWEISQKYKSQQDTDWDSKKLMVMEEICRAKLVQHPIVKKALLESGDAIIIKDYPDSFWGIGSDGVGRNEMGKLWMKLRDELK